MKTLIGMALGMMLMSQVARPADNSDTISRREEREARIEERILAREERRKKREEAFIERLERRKKVEEGLWTLGKDKDEWRKLQKELDEEERE